ncbi:MAG: hypothetical protein HDR08_09770 [Lachnospiraceae bacterium]|nr:hypothetical protein [Lachnospiraceae bacterium]MBD5511522.1 hypothetical protein [Lachnospiraceae bacterium]
MNNFQKYSIKIPHFYCLEYYEGEKKMVIEMDFREDYFLLEPKLITHWEKPYEDVIVDTGKKREILQNIREFLLTKTTPSNIFMKDL